ncbi:MAG: FHA domain-containing protein [Labilibaculum antarcticum]
MAVLENVKTGKKTILFCHHTIGRDQSNRCIIEKRNISRSHAIIHWEYGMWYLTDVSSNGTLVNDNHICHERVSLNLNDLISFSGENTDSCKLINADQPRSFLRAFNHIEDNIELPEGIVFWEDQTVKTIYRDPNQNFLYDDGEIVRYVNAGETFVINKIEYEFIENEYLEDTKRYLGVMLNLSLELVLSFDEEDVYAKIHLNDLIFDLGCRTYNQLLLQLVKIRQRDKTDGLIDEQRGWINCKDLVEILSKEILKEVDDYYVNNLIYRLRKHVLELHPYGNIFANIIERRNGKLRFGFDTAVIRKEELYIEEVNS